MSDNPTPPPNKGKAPLQTILFWLILISLPTLLILGNNTKPTKNSEIQINDLYTYANNGEIVEYVAVESNPPSDTLTAKIKIKQTDGTESNKFSLISVGDDNKIKEILLKQNEGKEKSQQIKIDRDKGQESFLSIFFNVIFPILFLIAIIYFLFARQLKNAGKGAMQFGKSKAKMLSPTAEKVTFKDVAGVEEAREEVEEIVDFLKAPEKYRELGGRLPKGCLMVGPPGTGKTLLARAIAGEAEVPFFSMSGSDFVEMFVGVGASRVRDLFEQAKKHQPCIIFIDEIDAVGRARTQGMSTGGHDEREQTLNALLVEMDGFENQHGVIILAATNRADVLDKALLRPGRFDRQINVDLPDIEGRAKILKVHAKKVKLDSTVDIQMVARGTAGFSGADLANVINEGALIAARNGKKAISHPDLEEARDKVRWGKERRSRKMSDKEMRLTAYHEAGHTLVNLFCENATPLHKVTIMPRGNAYLGATMFLPKEDSYSQNKSQMLDEIAVSMGGRIAEDITFGDITSGASGDIRQATAMARAMITQWGMSDDLGFILYDNVQQSEYNFNREFSEETTKKIDVEVRKIIDTQYARAEKMLKDNQDKLILLSETLLEKETMTAKEVCELLDLPYDGDEEEEKKLDGTNSEATEPEESESTEEETKKDDSLGDDLSPQES